MKSVLVLYCVAIVSLAFSSLAAAGTETNTPSHSPFAPIEFLVGGTWHGALATGTNEPKVAIESKFEWTGNHQGIRFESAWVIGGKRSPYCSGIYLWNPQKQQMEIVYSDARGALTEGFVEPTGQALQHHLKVVDKAGNTEQVQARMTHLEPGSYVNEIYELKEGQWQQVVSVHYEKTGQ